MNYVFRPHGIGYILLCVVKLVVFGGLVVGAICCSIFYNAWHYLAYGLVPLIVLAIDLCWAIPYKIVITENHISVAMYRELFMLRHKAFKIKYKGLRSMQYFQCILLGLGYISAIKLLFDNEKMKYIDVSRFSQKQIKRIIKLIKQYAEQKNSHLVEIFPAEIQGKTQKITYPLQGIESDECSKKKRLYVKCRGGRKFRPIKYLQPASLHSPPRRYLRGGY